MYNQIQFENCKIVTDFKIGFCKFAFVNDLQLYFAYLLRYVVRLMYDCSGNVQEYGPMKKMMDGVQRSQRNGSRIQLLLHLSVVVLKLVTKSQNIDMMKTI